MLKIEISIRVRIMTQMSNHNQNNKRHSEIDKIVYKKVGSGSYGFVISPGISSLHSQHSQNQKNKKNDKNRPDEDTSKQVSKLFFNECGETTERNKAFIVDVFIDPQNTFTPRLISYGRIQKQKAYEIIKSVEMGEKEKVFDIHDDSIPFITYQNGGENLDCFFMKKERTIYFEDLLPGFMTLLQGVQKMHRVGYSHSDIKPLNMVVDDKNKISLIDFGELVKHDKFKETLHKYRIDYKYCYYPPDFIFLSSLFKDNDKEKFQQRFREQYAKVFGFLNINDINLLYESFLNIRKFLVNDLNALNALNGKSALNALNASNHSNQNEKNEKNKKMRSTLENDIIKKAFARIEAQLEYDDRQPKYPSYFDTFALGISIRQIYIDAQRSRRIRYPIWCAKNIIPIFSGMCNPYLKGRYHIDKAVDSWNESLECYKNHLDNIQNQNYVLKPNCDGKKKRECNGMTKRNKKCCRLAMNGSDTCHYHK